MNKTHLFLLAGMVCTSLPAVAVAAPNDVKLDYTAFDLAEKKITLGAKAVWKPGKAGPLELKGENDCKMTLSKTHIERKGHGCDGFWNTGTPKPVVLKASSADLVNDEVTITLTPIATPAAAVQLVPKDGILEVPGRAPPNALIVAFVGSKWVPFKEEPLGGKRVFDLKALQGSTMAYANFEASGTAGYFLASIGAPLPPPNALGAPQAAGGQQPPQQPRGAVELTPAGAKVTGVSQDFCKADPAGAKYVVCLDLIQNSTTFRAVGTDASAASFVKRQIMRPNAGLLVMVRHDAKSTVGAQLGGERGLFVSRIVSNVPDANANAAMLPDVTAIVTTRPFGPRLPGAADLTVTETAADGTVRSQVIELIVEETHAGALRLGIASVFGKAVDRSYEARRVNGSQQSEIVATGANKVDFELVLATAPYLFDYLLLDGPRPAISAGPRFAPYLGIGLVSVKADENAELAFLRSMYFGAELEFVPSFSVAGAVVIRKVSRLSASQHIGSPTTDGVSTESTTGVGFGLVVNFSPEFFKIASKGSGGVL